TEDIVQDRLGSLFGVKWGTAMQPRVMIAGRMDEVGFMVTRITEKGFIKFQALGGWWDQVLLAQRVDVVTRSCKLCPGVIGSLPRSLRNTERRRKRVELSDMLIEVGAASREEAEQAGLDPGDPITPVCSMVERAGGKRLMSKAIDNRFGCAMA